MRASVRDTCETQRNAAEINSKIDTLKAGKEVVYRSDCKPVAPVQPSSVKPVS